MIIRVISSAALMAHQIPLIPSYKWKEIIEYSALIDLRIYHCCIFVWVCSISEKDLFFYKINEENKTVIVYAVVDGRQDYLNIIRGL